MGAWGTAIFSDDFALDIKDEYQVLLAFGVPEMEAFELVKNYFLKDVNDDDVESVFWFVVAAIQQKCGILIPEVKENALRCIANGGDLALWEDNPQDYKKRKAVFAKLKEQLLAPPLPKKKVSKPSGYSKPRWKRGDLVASRIVCPEDSDKWYYNKYVLYRVTRINRRSASAIKPDLAYNEHVDWVLYEWIGDDIPKLSLIGDLKYYKYYKFSPSDPYGLHLIPMSWIPKLEKYTLVDRSGEHATPKEEDICGTDNIFSMIEREKDNKRFLEAYKQYKTTN